MHNKEGLCMKNIGGTSRYIAFIDECGDHSMTKLDPDFPLFVLSMIITERQDYAHIIVPAATDLKLRYWNHEGVNLHSRDIRKALGPYALLQDTEVRLGFLQRISNFVRDMPFTLLVTAIRKDAHHNKSGDTAQNPYELALEFTLERAVLFLEGVGESELPIVAEARGKKEDESLERAFYRVMTNGTGDLSADRFHALDCPLVFRPKRDNIIGIQLADLCAHPCARHILLADQVNSAYEIAATHLYEPDQGTGWKVFP